jgi:hypothetical protein
MTISYGMDRRWVSTSFPSGYLQGKHDSFVLDRILRLRYVVKADGRYSDCVKKCDLRWGVGVLLELGSKFSQNEFKARQKF